VDGLQLLIVRFRVETCQNSVGPELLIINRALVREVLQTSGAVTLVILCIFLVVRALGFLQQAARGDIPVESVLVLVGLKMVSYVDVILPLVLYIAILMVLGRWSRDNEMTVLAACGLGISNFLKPLAALVLIVGSFAALFSFYLTPLSVTKGFHIEQEYRNRSEIAGVVPGVFMETRRGQGVYFVEEFDKNADRYEDIFVYKSSFGKEGVVVAKYGFKRLDELTGDQFLILKNGTRYEGNPGQPDYRIIDFETYALRIEPRTEVSPIIPVKGRPTLEIAADPHPLLVSELQWRVAKVIMVLVLAIFALAYSFVNPRQSRFPGMVMAFLTYFIYANSLGFAVAMIKKGKIAPEAGLWWIHVIFLAVAMMLVYRRSRNLSLVSLPRLRLRPRITA
jgi:lipopolysaccharide export system permease protein